MKSKQTTASIFSFLFGGNNGQAQGGGFERVVALNTGVLRGQGVRINKFDSRSVRRRKERDSRKGATKIGNT